MSDDKASLPDVPKEPRSTTDEVLNLLREEVSAAKVDDPLNNPELEQLFGKLSKATDGEGAQQEPADAAEGMLTLEEIALGAAGVTPPVFIAVSCPQCGSPNAKLARFCAMCGHELRPITVPRKVSADTAARPSVSHKSAGVTTPSLRPTSSDSVRIWKLGCVVLVCVVLALIANQQHWWQLLSFRRSSPPARTATAPAETVSHPTITQAQPPAPANAKQEIAAVQQPNNALKAQKNAAANKRTSKQDSTQTLPSSPRQSQSPVVEGKRYETMIAGGNTRITREPEAENTNAPPLNSVLPSDATASAASLLDPKSLPTPPAKISHVTPGALINKVAPVYPASARSVHASGPVTMRATIGKDGRVQQIHVVSGNPLLARAATDAVQQWRYRPAMLDGQPVETETNITINFKAE